MAISPWDGGGGEHHTDSKRALLILSAHMKNKLSSEEAGKVYSIFLLIITMAMWSNQKDGKC